MPAARRGRTGQSAEGLGGWMLDIPFILMLMSFAAVGLALIVPADALEEETAGVVRIYFYAAMLLGVAVIAMTIPVWNARRWYKPGLLSILPLLAFAWATLGYSVAKAETFNHLVRFTVFVFAVAGYTQVRGPQNFVRQAAIVFLIVNVISFFVALLLPEIGVHHITDALAEAHAGNWKGITGHKNFLGQSACVSSVLLLLYPSLITRSPFIRWSLFLCCFVDLVMADSSTNFVAFVACIAFYLIFIYGFVNRLRTFAGLFGFLVVAAGAVLNQDAIFGLLGKDASLSGRNVIWTYCLRIAEQHPLFGMGYAASQPFLLKKMQSDLFPQAVDAHSAYIQLFLDIGLIGLATVAFALVRSIYVGLIRPRGEAPNVTNANHALVLVLVWAIVEGFSERAPLYITSRCGFFTLGAIVAIGAGRIHAARARQMPATARAP